MKTTFMTYGSPAMLSFLLIVPFMIMEVVNRRSFQEDFPSALFFVMWLNAFGILLMLLPIARGRLAGNHAAESALPAQGGTLLTTPRSAATISIVLILLPIILSLLQAAGWAPVEWLINGPNPEQEYLPGRFIALGFLSLPVAAGVVASGPIVRTLRAGGSLFAHPLHLVIVAFLLVAFGFGLVSLIVDQWPCFLGVPNCD